MANDDAWQAGIDIASDRKDKQKKNAKKPKTGAGETADAAKGGGGGGGIFNKIMHVLSPISNLKTGGRVRKTGLHKLHKGELVLTAKQQRAAGLKKSKGKAHSRKRVAGKA